MDDKDYPCLNAHQLISNSAILSSNYVLLLSDLYTCIQVKKMVLQMKPYLTRQIEFILTILHAFSMHVV